MGKACVPSKATVLPPSPQGEQASTASPVATRCSTCNADSTSRWLKHPATKALVCNACYIFRHTHSGKDRPSHLWAHCGRGRPPNSMGSPLATTSLSRLASVERRQHNDVSSRKNPARKCNQLQTVDTVTETEQAPACHEEHPSIQLASKQSTSEGLQQGGLQQSLPRGQGHPVKQKRARPPAAPAGKRQKQGQREEPQRVQHEKPQQAQHEELQQRQREEPQRGQCEEPQQRQREEPQQGQCEEPQQRQHEELQRDQREEPQQRQREEPQQRQHEELQRDQREEPQQGQREEPQQRQREEPQQRQHEELQRDQREEPQQAQREDLQQRQPAACSTDHQIQGAQQQAEADRQPSSPPPPPPPLPPQMRVVSPPPPPQQAQQAGSPSQLKLPHGGGCPRGGAVDTGPQRAQQVQQPSPQLPARDTRLLVGHLQHGQSAPVDLLRWGMQRRRPHHPTRLRRQLLLQAEQQPWFQRSPLAVTGGVPVLHHASALQAQHAQQVEEKDMEKQRYGAVQQQEGALLETVHPGVGEGAWGRARPLSCQRAQQAGGGGSRGPLYKHRWWEESSAEMDLQAQQAQHASLSETALCQRALRTPPWDKPERQLPVEQQQQSAPCVLQLLADASPLPAQHGQHARCGPPREKWHWQQLQPLLAPLPQCPAGNSQQAACHHATPAPLPPSLLPPPTSSGAGVPTLLLEENRGGEGGNIGDPAAVVAATPEVKPFSHTCIGRGEGKEGYPGAAATGVGCHWMRGPLQPGGEGPEGGAEGGEGGAGVDALPRTGVGSLARLCWEASPGLPLAVMDSILLSRFRATRVLRAVSLLTVGPAGCAHASTLLSLPQDPPAGRILEGALVRIKSRIEGGRARHALHMVLGVEMSGRGGLSVQGLGFVPLKCISNARASSGQESLQELADLNARLAQQGQQLGVKQARRTAAVLAAAERFAACCAQEGGVLTEAQVGRFWEELGRGRQRVGVYPSPLPVLPQ